MRVLTGLGFEREMLDAYAVEVYLKLVYCAAVIAQVASH
jgi:hypothetical protein